MLKQQVLKLYRQALRISRKVDETQRGELQAWARSDFEMHRHQTAPVNASPRSVVHMELIVVDFFSFLETQTAFRPHVIQ